MTSLQHLDDPARHRLQSLDGFRGLGALCVLVHHFICAFLPAAYFGAKGANSSEFQEWLANSPLVVVYNGSFAVHAFFALSGFVIARSMGRNVVPLSLLVGRRYMRLVVPMLCSAIVAYALLRIYGDSSRAAADAIGNGWLYWYRNPSPTLFQASWDAVFNPFRFGDSNTNRVLWTMQIELFGSIAIYLVYRLLPGRWVVPCLAGLLVLSVPSSFGLTSYMGMAGGALLYEAHAAGRLRDARFLGPFLIAAGLLLGGRAARVASETHFDVLHKALSTFSNSFEFTMALGAICLLAGVLLTAGARRFLERPLPQFLGRISFALYLLHIPLLTTFATSLYLVMPDTPWRWLMVLPAYLFVSFGAAYLMTRLVDEPVTNALKAARSFPASPWIRTGHAVLASGLVGFVAWRLNGDPLSLVVVLFGYAGVFLVGQVLAADALRRAMPLATGRLEARAAPVSVREDPQH